MPSKTKQIKQIKRHATGQFYGEHGNSYDVSSSGVVHVNTNDLIQTATFKAQMSAASRVVKKSRDNKK